MDKKKVYGQKNTFKNILLVLTLILMFLPFLTTFSEYLTALIQKTPVYIWIQDMIVPQEIKVVAWILGLFGISVAISQEVLFVNGQKLMVSWNCLGWQSLLFFIVSLTGLQGKFKMFSKIEVIIFGIIGTFWINIFRMVTISLLGAYLPYVFAFVFHDYFATLLTIIWLLFLWWFSYRYVLEEKGNANEGD